MNIKKLKRANYLNEQVEEITKLQEELHELRNEALDYNEWGIKIFTEERALFIPESVREKALNSINQELKIEKAKLQTEFNEL